MDSLQLSFEAIMPIFLLMALGYFMRTIHLTDKTGFDTMNKLVFRVFLPTLLFYNLYNVSEGQKVNPYLILFIIVGELLEFVIGYGVVLHLTPDDGRRGVVLQGFFRTNYAILGIPLVEYICRDNNTGLASLLVVVVVPLINVLAVFTLERFHPEKRAVSWGTLLLGVFKNPLIIGCLLGLLCYLCNIKLPLVLERAVENVSRIASPLALIALGGTFSFKSIRGYIKEISTIVLVRLVIAPLLALPLAAVLGFTGEMMACLLIIFGGPLAVSAFSMVQQMGGDEQLAAQGVVFTSSFCILTLFVWIFVLNSLGLF